MDSGLAADGGTAVAPTDRATLREHLEQFASEDRVTARPDGTLTAEFGESTYFAIGPDGRVDSGMPLHGFDGPVDELRFDHAAAEIHVRVDEAAATYTFRRP